MAQHQVTKRIETLTEAGMSIEQIEAKLAHGLESYRGDYLVWNRADETILNNLVAEVEERAARTAAASVDPMATERQVSYALSLAAKNAAGSMELTAEQARKMTRGEISKLIDSLRSKW